MLHIRFLLLALISAALLTSCTRKQEEDSSGLRISVPQTMVSSKLSAQSGATLSNVIINVTGPNMAPILAQWERCSDCLVPTSIPGVLEIPEVPSGSDRLIQVLAVYKDTAGVLSIYYGDDTKALSGGDVPVAITVALLPMTDTLPTINGNIAGRYLKDDGTGPTGEILTIFNPGAGRQPMTIEKSLIVAGWFRVFGLDNITFDYQIREAGAAASYPLFSGPAHLSSTTFTPNNMILRASLPVHQRQQSGTTWQDADAEINVWGWFGSASAISSKKIKNAETASPQNFSRLRVYGSTTLLQATNTTAATKAQLQSTASALTAATFVGGTASATGTALVDYIPVSRNLVENGGDNMAGFRTPFQFIAPGNLFNIVTSTGTKTITGKVLPDVPSAIDSFRAYKKVGVGSSYHLQQVSCSQAAAGANGFASAHVTEGTMSGLNFSIQLYMNATEAASGTAIILCGVKNGVMYESGAFLYPSMFMLNNGGMQGGAPVKLAMSLINGSSGTVSTSSNVCQPLSLRLLDSNNLSAALNGALSFNLSGASFYYDQYCQTAIANPLMVNNNTQTIFTKINAGSATIAANLNSPPAGWTSNSLSVLGGTASGPASLKIYSESDLTQLNAMTSYSCVPALGVMLDAAGLPANNGYATAAFSSVASAGESVSLYTTGDCSGTASTSIPYYQSAQQTSTAKFTLSYSPTASRTETSASFIGNFTSGSVASLTTQAISVSHPGPVSQIQILSWGLTGNYFSDIPLGICVPVKFRLIDSNYNRLPFPISGNLSFSATVVGTNTLQLYNNSSCSSGSGNPLSVSVPSGDLEVTAYMKASGSANSDTFQLQALYNGFGGLGPQSGAGGFVQASYVIDPIVSSPNGNNVFVNSTPECVAMTVRLAVNGKSYFPGTNVNFSMNHAGTGLPNFFNTGGCSGGSTFAVSNSTGKGLVYYKNDNAGVSSPGVKDFLAYDASSVIATSASASVSLGLKAYFSNAAPVTQTVSSETCLQNMRLTFKDYFGALYTGSMPAPSISSSNVPNLNATYLNADCTSSAPSSVTSGVYDFAGRWLPGNYSGLGGSLSFTAPVTVSGILMDASAPVGTISAP